MSKELTPWFPRWTYPARKGCYIASVGRSKFYRYWNGRTWFYGGYTVSDAMEEVRLQRRWPVDTPLEWRGLAEKPKVAQ